MYRKLYVISSDFGLYFLLNRDFTPRGFEVIHVLPSRFLDLSLYQDGFIVSTPGEKRLFSSFSRVIFVSRSRYSVSRLLSLLSLDENDSFRHEVVVIGIDPGLNLGVSIRSDGVILHESVYFSLDSFLVALKDLLHDIPSFHYVIRLGNGNLDLVVLILNRLLSLFSGFRSVSFELVNEFGSTRNVRKIKNKKLDSLAAREISFRSGHVISIGEKKVLQRDDLPFV